MTSDREGKENKNQRNKSILVFAKSNGAPCKQTAQVTGVRLEFTSERYLRKERITVICRLREAEK